MTRFSDAMRNVYGLDNHQRMLEQARSQNISPFDLQRLQAHHEITHWIPDDGLLPEPPDYSAEGLMDINDGSDYLELGPITWDLIEAQESVQHSPYLQCHNIVPPHTEILDTKLQPVDRGDGG